jgi:hypothetical protein
VYIIYVCYKTLTYYLGAALRTGQCVDKEPVLSAHLCFYRSPFVSSALTQNNYRLHSTAFLIPRQANACPQQLQ